MARPQSSTPAAVTNPSSSGTASSGSAAGVAATHLFLSSIALCSGTLLPQILALLTQASAASAVAPRAFSQLQTLCTRLDDESCAEEEMDARWSGVRRARKEQRLSVVCEAGGVQLQLPSPPTPLRPGTPAHVAARTLVLVDLLGAPGFDFSSSDEATSAQGILQAIDDGARKQTTNAEAKRDQGWTEAVNALGWRPLHSFTRAGVRFVLRDDGAKGHFEVLVFRLSSPDSTRKEPPSSIYIIQAKVLHSLVPVPSPLPIRITSIGASEAAPHAIAPSLPPSAVEVQAALERGMQELDALQERCKGLLVFERDVE